MSPAGLSNQRQGITMKTQQAQQPTPARQPARVLGRSLARELTKEELAEIAGGQRKSSPDDSGHGTGSGLWGNLDD